MFPCTLVVPRTLLGVFFAWMHFELAFSHFVAERTHLQSRSSLQNLHIFRKTTQFSVLPQSVPSKGTHQRAYFRRDWKTFYVVGLDEALLLDASAVVIRQAQTGLRAIDAVHLVSAQVTGAAFEALVFLTFGGRQRQAPFAEGLRLSVRTPTESHGRTYQNSGLTSMTLGRSVQADRWKEQKKLFILKACGTLKGKTISQMSNL